MKIRAIAWVGALSLGTSWLSADPLPAEIMMARRLFAEARVREEAKDWVTAASKLNEALAIKETAGLRFHLAYCEEQQGLLVEALVDYERVEDMLTQSSEDFRSQLPGKKDLLHKRIPTVMIVMPPEIANAKLTVDGHVLPSSYLGKPVPLNPGHHTAEASAPDHVTFTVDLALSEGDAVVTNATMPLILAAAKPQAPLPGSTSVPSYSAVDTKVARSTSGSPARTIVLIGEAAVTLGGIAVGIGYTLAAHSADNRASSDRAMLTGNAGGACLQTSASATQMATPSDHDLPLCQSLQSDTDDARTDRFVSRLGFIGAGVGAAALVGTYLLWPSSRSKVAIVPSLEPKSAGLSAAIAF